MHVHILQVMKAFMVEDSKRFALTTCAQLYFNAQQQNYCYESIHECSKPCILLLLFCVHFFWQCSTLKYSHIVSVCRKHTQESHAPSCILTQNTSDAKVASGRKHWSLLTQRPIRPPSWKRECEIGVGDKSLVQNYLQN